MDTNFTLELNSSLFTLELHSAKNGRNVHLFAEFCYSEECPAFDFNRDLTEADAAQLTPERAAILFSQIAALAVDDIQREAQHEQITAALIASGLDLTVVPVYSSRLDRELITLVDGFCYGEACQN